MMNEILKNIPPEIIIDHEAGLSGYIVEELRPKIVVKPENTEHVCDVIKDAGSTGNSIITWGGGTRIMSCNPPTGYDIALDMKGLNNIIEYDPAEFLLIAEPGVTIDKINTTLRAHRQFLSLNPPLPERATIGGTVASNSWGYFRESYGTARDCILGLKFVNPEGKMIKSGGIVAKNVTGYDLTRLMIGSFGTLGIISEISVRISPIPDVTLLVTAGFPGIEETYNFISEIYNSHAVPSGIIILDRQSYTMVCEKSGIVPGESDFSVICRLEGIKETVEWQKKIIRRSAAANDSEWINDIYGETEKKLMDSVRDNPDLGNDSIMLKVAVPVNRTYEIMHYILSGKMEVTINIMVYAKCGILFLCILNSDQYGKGEVVSFIKSIRAYTQNVGGFVNIDSAPPHVKKQVNVWSEYPGMNLMKKIKQKFDPGNIFSPGRFL